VACGVAVSGFAPWTARDVEEDLRSRSELGRAGASASQS